MKTFLKIAIPAVATMIVANVAMSNNLSGRAIAYRQELGHAAALEPSARLSVLVAGDSRSRNVDTEQLCNELGISGDCRNVSRGAGDFATTYGIVHAYHKHLDDESVVVVGVSEYWVELGHLDARLGVLADPTPYMVARQPKMVISSFLPLSRARGRIVSGARRRIDSLARRLLNRTGVQVPPPPDPLHDAGPAGLPLSNVAVWFAPTSQESLDERRTAAKRLMRAIVELVPNKQRMALLLLPNPAVRDAWVDEHYPTRRLRGVTYLKQLAQDEGVRFIDLHDAIADPSRYRDLHHLNDEGTREGTTLVANALRAMGIGTPHKAPRAP